MASTPFKQTSSFIVSIRNLIVITAVFFLISLIGADLSGRLFITGLQQIHQNNKLLATMVQSTDLISNIEMNLEKHQKREGAKTAQFGIMENLKILDSNYAEISKLAADPAVKEELAAAVKALRDLKRSFELNLSGGRIDSAESIIIEEFISDQKESIRKMQILIKNNNDAVFNQIYEDRFRPLIVAVILSTFFFTVVLTIGFGLTGRIRRSIGNLISVTDAVAEKNRYAEAPILEKDEIGKLSFAFNNMLRTLRFGQERLQRLQAITASFSKALSEEQVYDVVFDQGMDVVNADSAQIHLVNKDERIFILKKSMGISQDSINRIRQIPLDSSSSPVGDTYRSNRLRFFRSLEDVLTVYPNLRISESEVKDRSWVFVPMSIGPTVLGVMVLSFPIEQPLPDEDRDFILSMAQICAQAIHRTQLYDRARNAINMRDEFLSIASHELRTPLTPLRLQIQNVLRKINNGTFFELPKPKIVKMVEGLDAQVERLILLVNDLLDVSRISAGKMVFNFELMLIDDVIQEVLAQYAPQLELARIPMSANLEPGLYAFLDRYRFEQVIINLLMNVVKYAPSKQLNVELKSHGGRALITVRDEGPGIKKEDQQRIFDRFERVKDKDNVGGLGLGLFISRQIIESHKGSIYVESEPGHGTTFFIEVPLVDQPSVNNPVETLLRGP